MGRTKKSEIIPEAIEKKPRTKKKIEETPEAVYIYHGGDNIQKVAKLITGKDYLVYKLLEFNGLDINNLKDGDILRWEI